MHRLHPRAAARGRTASALRAARRVWRAGGAAAAAASTGRGRPPAIQGRARGASPAGPGERRTRSGRPRGAQARGLVGVRPPRECPRAWARPPFSGGRWLRRTPDGAGEPEGGLGALRRPDLAPPRPDLRGGHAWVPPSPVPGAAAAHVRGPRAPPPPPRVAARPACPAALGGGSPAPPSTQSVAPSPTSHRKSIGAPYITSSLPRES